MAHPGGRPRKQVTISSAPPQPYYTVQEAAALTNSHVRTIQARLRDGTLKGKKLGGIWRIYPDSLVNVKVGADLNIQKEGERELKVIIKQPEPEEQKPIKLIIQKTKEPEQKPIVFIKKPAPIEEEHHILLKKEGETQ